MDHCVFSTFLLNAHLRLKQQYKEKYCKANRVITFIGLLLAYSHIASAAIVAEFSGISNLDEEITVINAELDDAGVLVITSNYVILDAFTAIVEDLFSGSLVNGPTSNQKTLNVTGHSVIYKDCTDLGTFDFCSDIPLDEPSDYLCPMCILTNDQIIFNLNAGGITNFGYNDYGILYTYELITLGTNEVPTPSSIFLFLSALFCICSRSFISKQAA